jgi:purine-binding chemotaxis protein CheW
LKQRAVTLAQPIRKTEPLTRAIELLTFTSGEASYGVDLNVVVEVIVLGNIVPIPCSPAFVLGAVNYRGRALPVLSLEALLEDGPPGTGGKAWAVVATVDAFLFGLAIDGPIAVAKANEAELVPVAAEHGIAGAFLQQLTGQMLAVLNLEAVCRSGRITVNDGA